MATPARPPPCILATMERISTAEAARRLGISTATVKRRIATGGLRAEYEPRPGGARWWVLWVDDLAVDISGAGAAGRLRGQATSSAGWLSRRPAYRGASRAQQTASACPWDVRARLVASGRGAGAPHRYAGSAASIEQRVSPC